MRIPTFVVVGMAAALVAAIGCSKPVTVETLRAARVSHEVELQSWAEIDREGEEGPSRARFTVRVSKARAPLALPCLTIDVLFLGPGGTSDELERRTVELDLTGIEKSGGTMQVSRSVEMPADVPDDASVQGMGVVLHEAVEESAVRRLCEAAALEGKGP